MGKKKQTAPDTFVDEKQIDEEIPAVTIETVDPEDEEPKDEDLKDEEPKDERDFESGKWIVNPERKAICGTRKGIIDIGEKVRPADFRGGIEQMRRLADIGAIVEK